MAPQARARGLGHTVHPPGLAIGAHVDHLHGQRNGLLKTLGQRTLARPIRGDESDANSSRPVRVQPMAELRAREMRVSAGGRWPTQARAHGTGQIECYRGPLIGFSTKSAPQGCVASSLGPAVVTVKAYVGYGRAGRVASLKVKPGGSDLAVRPAPYYHSSGGAAARSLKGFV
jgi:hypothetical protein